jgi:hypothetical protein
MQGQADVPLSRDQDGKPSHLNYQLHRQDQIRRTDRRARPGVLGLPVSALPIQSPPRCAGNVRDVPRPAAGQRGGVIRPRSELPQGRGHRHASETGRLRIPLHAFPNRIGRLLCRRSGHSLHLALCQTASHLPADDLIVQIKELAAELERFAATSPVDLERVREVDKRLRYCRNPEKDPNSALCVPSNAYRPCLSPV